MSNTSKKPTDIPPADAEADAANPKQSVASRDPEADTGPPSNTVKDPDNWTTGDESMTGAQASYLQTLSEEAGEPVRSVAEQGRCVQAHRCPAVQDGSRQEPLVTLPSARGLSAGV